MKNQFFKLSILVMLLISSSVLIHSCSKEIEQETMLSAPKQSMNLGFEDTEAGKLFNDSLVEVAMGIIKRNNDRGLIFDPTRTECFTRKELNECRKCIANLGGDYSPTSHYCRSHFDYMTADDDGIVDYVDNIVTMRDYHYVKQRFSPSCTGEMTTRNLTEPIYVNGFLVRDIVPAYQPFLNEACNTAWTNLTAVVNTGVNPSYIQNWPAYTNTVDDVDKSRYTFIAMVDDPYETDPTILAHLQVGWYMLPVDNYGGIVCEGEQVLHCFIFDELTEVWYYNQQVVRAGVLCQAQAICEYGYTVVDVDYVPYTTGYLYLTD
jgi:hypothetical protein